ncbi:MAG: hypothetical protein DRJ18_03400 [Candidatus Methanomethylicota archaeon]|nr:MAG: hypothetical protein DRJ18_03400 [Candidatus Verstraetearchaeota archaeon]
MPVRLNETCPDKCKITGDVILYTDDNTIYVGVSWHDWVVFHDVVRHSVVSMPVITSILMVVRGSFLC